MPTPVPATTDNKTSKSVKVSGAAHNNDKTIQAPVSVLFRASFVVEAIKMNFVWGMEDLVRFCHIVDLN